jgi:hypothetical protein
VHLELLHTYTYNSITYNIHIYIHIKHVPREKTRLIHTLDTQLTIRKEMDQQLIDEVVASEGLLRTLHDRNGTVEREMEEARKVEEGYVALLKVLKKNPPFLESHVKSMETEVELAEKQLADLCMHRKKLYDEAELTDHFQREQLSERIEYFEHARFEVAAKKKMVQREMRQHKSHGKGSTQRRRSTLDEAQRAAARDHRDTNSEEDSDSETASGDEEDVEISTPVMHFLNAIVRKKTLNGHMVKEGEHSYDEVRARLEREQAMTNSEKYEAMHGTPSPVQLFNAGAAARSSTKEGGTNSGGVGRKGKRVSMGMDMSNEGKGEGFGRGNATSPGADPLHPEHAHAHGLGLGLGHGHGVMGHGHSHAHLVPSIRKLTIEQVEQLSSNMQSFLPANHTASSAHMHSALRHGGEETGLALFRGQAQAAYELLMERTESSSADEFLVRYKTCRDMLEGLKKQQELAESHIQLLQVDHAGAY